MTAASMRETYKACAPPEALNPQSPKPTLHGTPPSAPQLLAVLRHLILQLFQLELQVVKVISRKASGGRLGLR
jgi:hypothetical protein